jgi:hypothetical protein
MTQHRHNHTSQRATGKHRPASSRQRNTDEPIVPGMAWDAVTLASWESFPASDAPAWIGGPSVGSGPLAARAKKRTR